MTGELPKHLIIASDASVFGGHEQVCLDFAAEVAKLCKVDFATVRANTLLNDNVRTVLGVEPLTMPITYRRFGAYLGALYFDQRREFRKILQRFPNATILLAQGRIETAVPFMAELKAQGRPFHSIIPFAHKLAEIKGTSPLRALEDAHRRSLYSLAQSYVVPSETAKAQLRSNGVHAPIHILHNLAQDISHSPPARGTVIRCIGRIDFWQKQQDLLLRAIADDPTLFDGISFEFAGTGPDEQKLVDLIREYDLGGFVTHLGQVDRDVLFHGITAVLMPSRFEGVPLTMLEALSAGLPFIGSKIDIFEDYLPPVALVTEFSARNLRSVIDAATADSRRDTWNSISRNVSRLHGAENFSNSSREIAKRIFGI